MFLTVLGIVVRKYQYYLRLPLAVAFVKKIDR